MLVNELCGVNLARSTSSHLLTLAVGFRKWWDLSGHFFGTMWWFMELRDCVSLKKWERYCKLARTFACQHEVGLHNIFQPGFQCLMSKAFLVSLDIYLLYPSSCWDFLRRSYSSFHLRVFSQPVLQPWTQAFLIYWWLLLPSILLASFLDCEHVARKGKFGRRDS